MTNGIDHVFTRQTVLGMALLLFASGILFQVNIIGWKDHSFWEASVRTLNALQSSKESSITQRRRPDDSIGSDAHRQALSLGGVNATESERRRPENIDHTISSSQKIDLVASKSSIRQGSTSTNDAMPVSNSNSVRQHENIGNSSNLPEQATSPPPPEPDNGTQSTRRRKNVVFILIDDLGIRDLVCYRPEEHHNNSSFHMTPNIDQLAQNGVLFQNAYGSAPTCSLSRAGLYTGIAPSRLGMFHRSLERHNFVEERKCFQKYNARTLPLHRGTTPLGTAFSSHGYQTGFVGKWHNGGTPADCGFDRQIGTNGAGYLNTQFWPYRCDATARTQKYCRPRAVQPPKMEIPGQNGTCVTDHLTLEALQTLREFASHKDDKPFLLVLSHYAVHYPIESRDDYEREFESRRRAMGLLSYHGKYEKNIYTRTVQSNPSYAGLLKSVDDSVGRVVAELQALGIDKDTYVVFTSDNGGLASHHLYKTYPPTSNMPYDLGKVYLGEGGIRVPLIISGPDLPSGTRIDYQSVGTDIYPTLLDLCGLPLRPEDHIDGKSLVGAMKSDTPQVRGEPIFWQADYEWFWGNKTEYPTAILWGDWKLMERYPSRDTSTIGGNSRPQLNLYNIRQDPGETTDLFDTHKCEAARLHARLEQWRSEWFQNSYFDKAAAAFQCRATPNRAVVSMPLNASCMEGAS